MDTSISVSLYVWKIWLFLQQEPILLQISHLPLNTANLIFSLQLPTMVLKLPVFQLITILLQMYLISNSYEITLKTLSYFKFTATFEGCVQERQIQLFSFVR